MRYLIYAINLTLDGCCDHTKTIGGMDELLDYHADLLRDADLLVYGRITYQLMVPYWHDIAKSQSGTKAEIEFAKAFDAIDKKVVFSRSLDKAEEKNTRIVNSDMMDEILKLKQEQGKNILTGGVDIPSQLIQLGLVDEFRVIVQPIIVGEGRRLFDGVRLQDKLPLKLVDSTVFKSGRVALRYLKS